MDSHGKTETLKEQLEAIANVPVATAIANMQQEYIAVAKRLRGYSIQIHGSILQMLQTEFNLRQDEAKNAIDEYKFQAATKQRAEQLDAQKKLEAEQAEIAEANRPKLAVVGQRPVQ
jgi:primosomal protein N'